MDENNPLKKSVFEQYNELSNDSKLDVIFSMRESIDKEILGYQQGIDYQTKQFDKHIKELEKTGRSKEIPLAKQHAEEIISELKADLHDATKFRDGFAKGHINYLKETNNEGFLFGHMNKLFPEKFPLDKNSNPKQQTTKPNSDLSSTTVNEKINKATNPKKVLAPQELTASAKKLESVMNGDGPLLLDAPKSYKAKEKLKKAAEGRPSGSPISLSYNEDPLSKNLGNIKGSPAPIKTNEQIKNYIQKNRWAGAGIGLGVGIAKSIFDSEDDSITTSATKAVKASAAVIGVSYLAELGLDYASSNDIQVAKMWTPTTVQDYVKGQVAGSAQKVKEAAETERKLVNVGGKAGTMLKIGAGVVGVASILDVGQRISDNREAKRIKHEQEKALIQKEKKRKEKNKEQSYGYIQDGEILFDLFGERTGHHKMGNSKFI